MKKYLVSLLFLLTIMLQNPWIASGQELQPTDTIPGAQIEAPVTDFDFGDVFQGQKVEHDFSISNTGDLPLVIDNVISTCGCTAPAWPNQPIQPGATDTVRIVFDTSAKMGRQNKVITIRSNAKAGDFRLRISAMVLPANKRD